MKQHSEIGAEILLRLVTGLCSSRSRHPVPPRTLGWAATPTAHVRDHRPPCARCRCTRTSVAITVGTVSRSTRWTTDHHASAVLPADHRQHARRHRHHSRRDRCTVRPRPHTAARPPPRAIPRDHHRGARARHVIQLRPHRGVSPHRSTRRVLGHGTQIAGSGRASRHPQGYCHPAAAPGSAEGQMSASTQRPQCGRRASHTARPWRMRRSEKRPRSSGAIRPLRSNSAFTGSVSVVSLSLRERRPTWVSTGSPGRSKRDRTHHVGGLAPHPGQLHELFERGGHLAVVLVLEGAGHAEDVLGLRPVEAGGEDDALDVFGIRVREVVRGRVLREQRGRDLVDVLVGGLRGEDRRGEQLERVVVDQRALGARVLLGQADPHLFGTFLRTTGSGHPPNLPSA